MELRGIGVPVDNFMRTMFDVKKFALSKSGQFGLLLVLGLGYSQEFARAKKWIVKVREPSGYMPQELKSQIRAFHARSLASEISSQNFVQAQAQAQDLAVLGITIVSGDEETKRILESSPDVEYFEENKYWKPFTLSGSATPSGQQLSPWMAGVLGLAESEPDAELGYSGGSPVKVAVIDTGLTVTHPYIVSALAVNTAEQNGTASVDDDGNGYVDDIYGGNAILKTGNVAEVATDHGSHVAGLVKAVRDQAIGTYPDAQAVQILPIRFIDQSGVGSTAGALAAVAYAINRGAKVINASWGARGVEAFSQALYDSMYEAYFTHDIFISVAAGNAEGGNANNNDVVPYFPAGFNIPGLVSVASMTPEYSYTGVGQNTTMSALKFSDFSNYGSRSVHIAAPGGFRNAQLDSSGVYSLNAQFTSSSNYYIRKKGTSMAAPVLAGIAAVIRAINPSLTAFETKQIILDTATASAAASGKTISGAYANASVAFSTAENAISAGLKPAASGDPYTVYESQSQSSSSAGEQERGGGCGMLKEHSSDPGSKEGPLGGNSLILLSLFYFAMRALRRFQKRHSH